jgi:hypothetical protein
VTSEFYAWQIQLVLSLLFAAHLARIARRKGRHPFGAALLMLTFANGWPLVFAAVGREIAAAFGMNDTARSVYVRVFGYGGVMFGVAVSYAIVGCLKPIRRSHVADVDQPRDRDHFRPE